MSSATPRQSEPAAAAGLRRLAGLADKPAERDQAGLAARRAELGKGRGQLDVQQGSTVGADRPARPCGLHAEAGPHASVRVVPDFASGADPVVTALRGAMVYLFQTPASATPGKPPGPQWLNRVNAAALS
jgi:hypothetical protein